MATAYRKNMLIDEYPLLVLPSLAVAIGLNEAIALQQLHYWMQNPKGTVIVDGEKWTYNTYEEWQQQNFPFWSERTVQRVFLSLEKMDLVIAKQMPNYDRKKYYRIHYANLALWTVPNWQHPLRQDGTIDDDNLAPSSLEETTEETTRGTKSGLDFENMTVVEAKKLAPLKVWLTVFKELPAAALWEIVHDTIQQYSITVEKLKEVKLAWQGRGYRLQNVLGILEWCTRGIPEFARPNGSQPGPSGTPPGFSLEKPTLVCGNGARLFDRCKETYGSNDYEGALNRFRIHVGECRLCGDASNANTVSQSLSKLTKGMATK